MSSSLTWEPKKRDKVRLPDELKAPLRKRHSDPVDMIMNCSDKQYLQGLIDALVPGAAELYEAIEKHGPIIVREEW